MSRERVSGKTIHIKDEDKKYLTGNHLAEYVFCRIERHVETRTVEYTVEANNVSEAIKKVDYGDCEEEEIDNDEDDEFEPYELIEVNITEEKKPDLSPFVGQITIFGEVIGEQTNAEH